MRTVVLSHLHYDHAGNVDDFPNAQVVLQRAELEYATGPAMRHHRLSHFFEVDDVTGVVRRLFAGAVTVVEGATMSRPGSSCTSSAGTPGAPGGAHPHRARLDRAGLRRRPLLRQHHRAQPFPALVDLEQVLDGYERIEALADSPAHIVPGHDPQLFTLTTGGQRARPPHRRATHVAQGPDRGGTS